MYFIMSTGITVFRSSGDGVCAEMEQESPAMLNIEKNTSLTNDKMEFDIKRRTVIGRKWRRWRQKGKRN